MTDVTGDGTPDVIANYLNQDFDVLTNNGDGTFGPASKQSQIVFNDSFTDANGDGKVDAVGSSPSFGKKLAIALGNGNGTFQEPLTLTLGDVGFNGTAVADVTGDGKADVLVVDNDQDRVVILTGGAASDPSPGPGTDPDPGTDPGTDPRTGTDSTPDPAPAVDLTPASPSGLGAQLVAGQKVRTSVNIVNGGDQPSVGPVTVKLYASTDGVIDGGDIVLTEFTKNLKITAKKSKTVKLNFQVPSVGDGAFQVLTEVSGGGDNAAANNAAAGATVNFVVPKVDVSAGIGIAPALKAGKKARIAVDLRNAGGADIKSPATLTLFATTDGTLNGQEVQLATVTVPLSLKAGKVKKAKLSFLVPAELTGQTRTLVARVQLADDVQTNNDVTTGEAMTVE